MAGAIIGIDPHKGSHTAIAIDVRERQLGQVRVRASARQAEVLLQWAARWPTRAWAIEGARGLGYLLAQQLIAADQRVLDVPPKLAARVRLLNSGQINKNDENDARSVAITALRAHDLPVLSAEDQTMVMRVWARRYHDLGRLRTQVICRLFAAVESARLRASGRAAAGSGQNLLTPSPTAVGRPRHREVPCSRQARSAPWSSAGACSVTACRTRPWCARAATGQRGPPAAHR